MEIVSQRNGFVVRADGTDSYPFQVYHPNFDGVFIDGFKTLSDAHAFCDEEDPDSWAETIRQG